MKKKLRGHAPVPLAARRVGAERWPGRRSAGIVAARMLDALRAEGRAGALLEPGTVLAGRYQLEGVIGAGGFGVVWRARHLHLQTEHAVKLFEPPPGADPRDANARFLQEARVTARLKSPHVARVFDFGMHEQLSFLVMELLSGRSLGQELAALRAHGRRLSPAQTAAIIAHVAEALELAHGAQVVHRDLKPDNIFLVHEAEGQLAKVLDFGIAKWSTDASPRMTTTRTVMGTAHYMSPEQFQSARQVDLRADLWSLGVIAFECLTGQVPFPGDSFIHVAFRVCKEGPLRASALAPVPAGFDAWFARATALDREQRFASALEQARALQAVCAARLPEAQAPLAAATGGAAGGAAAWRVLAPDDATTASSRPAGAPLRRFAGAAFARGPRQSWQRWRGLAAAGLLLAVASVPLLRGALRSSPQPGELALSLQGATGLQVLGDAGFVLWVDGRKRGALPQTLTDLEPGSHSVRVSGGSRHDDFESNVLVEKGNMTQLGPLLLPVRTGVLKILPAEGAEGARVKVVTDDNVRRLEGLPAQLELDGKRSHEVIASREGYRPFRETVTFVDGKAERSVLVTLFPDPTAQGAAGSALSGGPTQPHQPARRRPAAAPASKSPAPSAPATPKEPSGPPGAPADCEPPWYIDVKGIQRLKPKCL